MTNTHTVLAIVDMNAQDSLLSLKVLRGLAAALCTADVTDIALLLLTAPETPLASGDLAGFGAAYYAAASGNLSSMQFESIICQAIEQLQPMWIVTAGGGTLTEGLIRAAGICGLTHLSNVIRILPSTGGQAVSAQRAIYSGTYIETLLLPARCAFTISAHAFAHLPNAHSGTGPLTELMFAVPESRTNLTTSATTSSGRPPLNRARIAVSGGRPLQSREEFESLIGGLADLLGGAAGATRAAVDAGIAPPELQIGQTGVHIAPDLYVAAGVSGSIQHTAGIRDARTVVAINTDPDAPIFKYADYGIIGDLHSVIPDLISELK